MEYTYLVVYSIKFANGDMANGDIEILAKHKLNSYEQLKETRRVISNNVSEELGKSVESVVILNLILLKRQTRRRNRRVNDA